MAKESAAEKGAEYFVNKQGSNANTGTSRSEAFLTIQRGLDALKPGDTLTIGPGEYFESVKRDGLGDTERETVIRAEIPRTVLLRGDTPAPEFKKVEGYRLVYSAPFDQPAEAVLEHATMKVLAKKPSLPELEFEPGACFYDAEAKTLYMSTGDQRPPHGRRYTVAVSGQSGLLLRRPKRVAIEGLSATGFFRTTARVPSEWVDTYQWGIVLDQPESCAVRDCCAFLNCGGIMVNDGRGNVIERCLAHDNPVHNIQFFGGDNNIDNVARDCYAYRGHSGIHSYMTFSGEVRLQRNIAWGHSLDYSTKGVDSQEYAFLEECVALNDIRIHNLSNCVLGGASNEYRREADYSDDTIAFGNEENLDVDREFADPVNMDWRLQGDSRFGGARSDGKDRGLCPEHDYRIFFVSPDGDDGREGTSVASAWKTLPRALKELKPGDTLYLSGGAYRVGGGISLGQPGEKRICIRARGRERAVIEDALEVTGAGVSFERLDFADSVAVRDSEEIEFVNCSFRGATIENTRGLRIAHGLFLGEPLRLKKAPGAHLSGNIFANADGPAVVAEGGDILYSDYNSYQDASQAWTMDGQPRSLDDLRPSQETASVALTPEIAADGGAPRLLNPEVFAGWGPQGTSLGRYQEYEEETPQVFGPFVHSVTDTTANLEWWTSVPATCEVAWGETPDTERVARPVNVYRFSTFSLTNLEPGKTYTFRVNSVEPPAQGVKPSPVHRPEAASVSFSTATTAPEPATYYVAPDGDDANTGLSREQAWRTVGAAGSRVGPGDTVLIAGGVYSETVRLRATGCEGKPILFRCAPGEKARFDGDHRSLSQAFIVSNKRHVHIDGLYFKNFFYRGPAVMLLNSDDVTVTRCFSDGRGPGYSGPQLEAYHCKNVTVRNCVSIDGMGCGLEAADCPDMLIENNCFFRNFINSCILVNEPDQKVAVRKNVFCESLPFKSPGGYFTIGKIESIEESDNCYYMRLPDEERLLFSCYGDVAYARAARHHGMRTEFDEPSVTPELVRMSLRRFKEIKGETGSFLGNPWLRGTLGMKEGEMVLSRGRWYPVVLSDNLVLKEGLDFPDLFATDPKTVEKGIGLVPEDFADFGFE